MKHLGDITKLKGSEVPLVDIVTGGSPCQDLSVAGKREGLAGERSGLFMEQIRLIKEMRESDRATGRTNDNIRPRYMVWENVPGAFSSNKGEDFRCVLEETAKVADSNAIIPRLATGKDGKQKWSKSGCIMGDGWSIAWRVHDAQFWGVPQRRKRISLVADFGGETAPEILFERKGMSGDITESGEERKDAATDVERDIGEAIGFTNRGFESGNVTETLRSEPHGAYPMVAYDEGGVACGKEGKVTILNPSDSQGNQVADSNGIYPTLRGCGGAGYQQGYLFERKNSTTVFGISSYDSNAMKSSNPHSGIYEADTSRTLDLNGGSPACNQGGMAVVQSAGVDTYNQTMDVEVAQPLRAADGGDSTPKVVCIECNGQRESHKGDGYKESETMYTLNTIEKHAVCIENHPADSRVKVSEDGICQTLSSRMGTGGGNVPMVMAVESHAQDARYKIGEINQPLSANMEHDPANGGLVMAVENHPQDSRVKIREDGIVQTLDARMGMGGGNVPMVMEQHTFADVAACRNAQDGRGGVHSQMMDDPEGNFVLDTVTASKATFFTGTHQDGVAETLVATDYKDPQVVAYGVDAYNQSQSEEVAKSLNSAASDADHVPCVYGQKVDTQVAQDSGETCQSVVRRLTPLECERLQGFPDHWTDIGDWVDSKGKTHKGDSDSPRYKALGNSIALPFWQWMANRMVQYIDHEPTMASLFDGIGGFPLVYTRAGCKPIWASEIEEFPIAVTKIRFKEEETHDTQRIF